MTFQTRLNYRSSVTILTKEIPKESKFSQLATKIENVVYNDMTDSEYDAEEFLEIASEAHVSHLWLSRVVWAFWYAPAAGRTLPKLPSSRIYL